MKRILAVVLMLVMMLGVLPADSLGAVISNPVISLTDEISSPDDDTDGNITGDVVDAGDGDGDADTGDDTTDPTPTPEPTPEPVPTPTPPPHMSMSPMSSGFPYELGNPTINDRGGNTKGWDFDDNGENLSLATLKEAQYLVFEVSKKPEGWMALILQSDNQDYKWNEVFIEFGDFGDDNANRPNIWDVFDYRSSSIVLPLDQTYRWDEWDGGDDPVDTHYFELSEILTEETERAEIFIAYHLWDNDDPWGDDYGRPQTGWEDLGVTAAYLTNDYDMSFGEPGPAYGEYDLTIFNNWRNIYGFRIEVTGLAHDPWCGGGLDIYRASGENMHLGLGWDPGWFTNRNGKTYIEFSFENLFIEDWHGFQASRADITIECGCKGAGFGEIIPIYGRVSFPGDIEEGHPAYNDASHINNLGLYDSQWGAYNYVLPNATMSRFDLAMQINRITGYWEGVYEHWLGRVWEFAEGGIVYGDEDPNDDWRIPRIMNAVENGYMRVKSGFDWWNNPDNNDEWEQTLPYYDCFRGDDRVTRGTLYYAAAVIAGLSPTNETDARSRLYSNGIISSNSAVLDDEVDRTEVYNVLCDAIKYLAAEDEYDLPTRDWKTYDLRWTTTGFEHEGSADVPVAAFRQYNSIVLELSDEPQMWDGISVDLEQSWDMYWRNEWYDFEDAYKDDEGKHYLILHYDHLIDWGTNDTAAIFHAQYNCCDVNERWQEVSPNNWQEVHQPGCNGTWAALGVVRAFLANTEPPLRLDGWYLDPGAFDEDTNPNGYTENYDMPNNEKGWNIGSFNRFRDFQVVTLSFDPSDTSLQAGHQISFINNSYAQWDNWDNGYPIPEDGWWHVYEYTVTQADIDAGRIIVDLQEQWDYKYHDTPDGLGRNGYKFGISYFGPNGEGYDDLNLAGIHFAPHLNSGITLVNWEITGQDNNGNDIWEGITYNFDDRYYLGNTDWLNFFGPQWDGDGYTKGWQMPQDSTKRHMLEYADSLVIEIDRWRFENAPDGMQIVLNYDDTANSNSWPWVRTDISDVIIERYQQQWHDWQEVIVIDLTELDGWQEAIASDNFNLIIAPNWKDLNIQQVYLNVDNMRLFDQYAEPLVYAGFEDDDDWGGFEANGSPSLSRITDPYAPEGNYVLQINSRKATNDGIILKGSMFIPGEAYFLSAWVKHNQSGNRNIHVTLDYDDYPRVTIGDVPGGEWTKISGFFTTWEDFWRTVNLYFETDWVEVPSAGDLFDFYIDEIIIWGPENPPPPPPPPLLYAEPSSLKDIYSDMFDISVVVPEDIYELETFSEFTPESVKSLIDWHLQQHYVTQYDENSTPQPDYEITLDDSGTSLPAITGTGLVILVTIDETATIKQVEELAELLIDNEASVDEVIFASPFELFSYTDSSGSRYRFIPKNIYKIFANATSAGSAYIGTNVIINQVYGSGPLDGTGSISHSFVELYNPTASPVDLKDLGYSLQIQNGYVRGGSSQTGGDDATEWYVYDFGTVGGEHVIEPFSSYLIRLHQTDPLTTVSYIIPRADVDWTPAGVVLSNRAFSVALVANGTQLPMNVSGSGSTAAALGVIDWVGAANSPGTSNTSDVSLNGNGDPVRISKQVAARRIAFGAKDGTNDSDNYEGVDYRGLDGAELERVRPRSSHDGAWGKYVNEFVKPSDVDLTFSIEGGIYSTGQSLTLDKGTDAGNVGIIWYTKDGSDPIPYTPGAIKHNGSALTLQNRTYEPNYFSAIDLSGETDGGSGEVNHSIPNSPVFKGNVIRAQVYDIYGNALTDTITNSYIINPPPGFANLPVISISANEHDLFDATDGIFMPVNAFNKGVEYERGVYMEFFNAEGSDWVQGFEQNLGLRIHGGWSRGNPQKSMRFYADSGRYDNSPLIQFDMFDGAARAMDGTEITEFKRFLLRNFGNDSGGTFMRDNMMQDAARGMNLATQDYRYAVVMLNGEFWGLYEIRERIDEYFVASNYGVDRTNVAIFENPHPEHGATDIDEAAEYPADHELYKQMGQWFKAREGNPLSNADYLTAQRYMHIDSLIDMYILESYGANFDWPQNNIRVWRYQTADYPAPNAPLSYTDGRWRWILNDMDGTFDIYGNDFRVDCNYFVRLLDPADEETSEWTLFFRVLMTNQQFRERFVNRYFDIMNTHLDADHISGIIGKLYSIITPINSQQTQRWNNGFNNWSYNNMLNFNNGRKAVVTNQLRTMSQFGMIGRSEATLTLVTDPLQGYINLNGIDIKDGTPSVTDPENWSGTYLTGLTQTIKATPMRGWDFSHFYVTVNGVWQPNIDVNDDTLVISLTDNTVVEAVFTKGIDKYEIVTYSYTPEDTTIPKQSYPATGGERQRFSQLSFVYALGNTANIGRTNRDRAAVNVPNATDGWFLDASSINEIFSGGWVITLNTLNFKNLTFTAEQASSNNGPGEFKLAYRTDPNGTWIPFGEVAAVSANTSTMTTAVTFDNVSLPAEIENMPYVQLKVYISSNVARIGGTEASFAANDGNTSINNIVIEGEKIDPTQAELFAISIDEDIKAGTVISDRAYAFAGDTVRVETAPIPGWKYKDNTLVYITEGNVTAPVTGTSFEMPANDVVLSAEFEPDDDSWPKEIAEFYITERTPGESVDATGGKWRYDSDIKFVYAEKNGGNDIIASLDGTAGRNSINAPNNAGRWYPTTGASSITADYSAGWIITLKTEGYSNISFTADQGSSGSGPRDFKLAYRIGDSGNFTDIPNSGISIESDADAMGNTYYMFDLPSEIDDKGLVQLKVYICSDVPRTGTGTLNATGGNTSINNISFMSMDGWSPHYLEFEIEGAGTIIPDRQLYAEGDRAILTVNAGGGWKLIDGSLKFDYDGVNDYFINGNTFIVPGTPGGIVKVKASFELINPDVLTSPVLINQVGAVKPDGDGGVSRGFVELVNTSDSDVSLDGMSLQIANAMGNSMPTGAWSVYRLFGNIRANESMLIIVGDNVDNTAAYQIPNGQWDMQLSDGRIDNRGFSVALVRGSAGLPMVMTESNWNRIYDLVGAHNTNEQIQNILGKGPARVSGSEAIRRIDRTNTADNVEDFESLRYANYTSGDPSFAGKLPQGGGWFLPVEVSVTVTGRETVEHVTLNYASAGTPKDHFISGVPTPAQPFLYSSGIGEKLTITANVNSGRDVTVAVTDNNGNRSIIHGSTGIVSTDWYEKVFELDIFKDKGEYSIEVIYSAWIYKFDFRPGNETITFNKNPRNTVLYANKASNLISDLVVGDFKTVSSTQANREVTVNLANAINANKNNTLYIVLDRTEYGNRVEASQAVGTNAEKRFAFQRAIAQMIDDGIIMTVSLERYAPKTQLQTDFVYDYVNQELQLGQLYKGAPSVIAGYSNTTANSNRAFRDALIISGDYKISNFGQVTPAGNPTADRVAPDKKVYVRVLGNEDQNNPIFASEIATISIAKRNAWTAGGVSNFVDFTSKTDALGSPIAVWKLPDNVYTYRWYLTGSTSSRTTANRNAALSDPTKVIIEGNNIPLDLLDTLKSGSSSTKQFQIVREARASMGTEQANSGNMRIANVGGRLAYPSVNASRMTFTAKVTEEFLIIDVDGWLRAQPDHSVNTATPPVSNNYTEANQRKLVEEITNGTIDPQFVINDAWQRVTSAQMPIDFEWEGYYVFRRTAATETRPYSLVSWPARDTSSGAKRNTVKTAPLPTRVSIDHISDEIGRLLRYNPGTGVLTVNTLNSIPQEYRWLGYTNKTNISVSTNGVYYINATNKLDLRYMMNIQTQDVDYFSVFVQLQGNVSGSRTSYPVHIRINSVTGDIEVAGSQ